MTAIKIKWNHDFIRQVAAQYEKYKGDPLVERLTDFISQSVYTSPSHFALEMIQNADDEKSTEINFYFEKDNKIIVTNNGKKFSKNDVKTICYAGYSLKKNKKGFFGIGFKSVKRVTDTPQIISGNYNFVIQKYYHPDSCDEIPRDIIFNPQKGAIFVLPLRSKKEYDNIFKRCMEDINEYLLSFLDYIKKIYIIDRRKKKEKTYVLSYDRKDGILKNSYTGDESSWKVFKKVIQVPRSIRRPMGKERVRRTEMALAFPADMKNTPGPQKLFCYLPTERFTGYPFIVQGDFLPILGRSNIDEEHPWNKHLLKQLPELIADAFENLKDNPNFRLRILSFLPLKEKCHDELFIKYIDGIYKEVKNREIVSTRDKSFKKPVNSIDLPHDLWELFSNEDLQEIYKNEKFVISDGYNDFERMNLSLLHMERFGLDNIILFFENNKGISRKVTDPNWFVSIYAYINDNIDDYEKDDLDNIPFLLSETGELVYPVDPKKMDKPRLIANQYMNKETSFFSELFNKDELIFLHKRFRISRSQKKKKNYDRRLDKIHQLFEFLGVIRTVEAHHIITQLILPKFQEARNRKRLGYKKAVLFTNFILENLSYYRKIYGSRTKTDDWQIFSDIRSKILVLAEKGESTGKKRNVFLSPIEVYIRGERKKLRPEKYFRGLTEVPFISKKYFSKRILGSFTSIPITQVSKRRKIYSWNDFFHLIGCWEIPRVIPITRSYSRYDLRLKDDFPDVDWDYRYDSTMGYEIRDWVMPELTDTIQKYVNTKDKVQKDRLKDRLIYIRESIAKNWKKYKEYTKAEVSYFYFSSRRMEVDSTFYQQLKKPWFPTSTDGKLIPPSKIYKDTIDNRYLAPQGLDFIDIPSASKEFYKEIGVTEDPNPKEVLERLQKIKTHWDKINKIPPDSFKKMEAYYKYLVDKSKINPDLKDAIKSIFSRKYLLFLPTKVRGKSKIWWHRDQVFATEILDYSLTPFFQPLFQEGAYSIELKETFISLDVRISPSFREYKEIFQHIMKEWKKASTNKKLELKGKISYALEGLSTLIESESVDDDEEIRKLLDENIFLTDQNEFLTPNEIYLKDDYEIYEVFQNSVPTLWYNGEIASISSSLIKVGFKSLKDYKDKRKTKFLDKEFIHKDDLEKMIEFCEIIEAFIENRFSTSYDKQRENIARFKDLQIYTAKNIQVTYFLDGQKRIKNNVPVYLSKNELVISTAENDPWLEVIRDDFSKCLALIFGDLDPHLRPLINDLHQNPEDINIVIQKWGLEKERVFKKYVADRSQIIKIPLTQEKKELETFEEEVEEEPIAQVVDVTTTPIQTPQPKSKDEEVFPLETINGFIIKNIKTGEVTTVPLKRRKIRKTKLPKRKGISKTYTPFSSQMTEDIAVEIVRKFEESQEQRNIKDVRDNEEEGCDLISSGKRGNRLIEIKASKGKRSQIKLQPSQYKRAKEDKEKYYIYKVENIEKGKVPHIEIVQNPIENPKITIVHIGEFEIDGWKNSDKISIDVRIEE